MPVHERADAYRYLATAFRYPEARVLEALVHVPASLEPLAPLARVRAALPADADALELEFVRAFGHAVPREYPPYETEFTAAEAFRQTATLGDIAGFYRAFGVQVVPGIGERADALEVELEFLHLLAVKEAHALALGLEDRASLVRDATAKFLTDHVARWVPSFARRLEGKAPSELYRALGALLEAWLLADLAELGLPLPPQVGEPHLLRAQDWVETATRAADE